MWIAYTSCSLRSNRMIAYSTPLRVQSHNIVIVLLYLHPPAAPSARCTPTASQASSKSDCNLRGLKLAHGTRLGPAEPPRCRPLDAVPALADPTAQPGSPATDALTRGENAGSALPEKDDGRSRAPDYPTGDDRFVCPWGCVPRPSIERSGAPTWRLDLPATTLRHVTALRPSAVTPTLGLLAIRCMMTSACRGRADPEP